MLLKALAVAVGVLFVAGVVSLFAVDGDNGTDTSLGDITTTTAMVPTTIDGTTIPGGTDATDTTVDAGATTTAPGTMGGPTTTPPGAGGPSTTTAGSGIGTGGNGAVASGGGEHPETGAPALLVPGLAIAGAALAARRLRRAA